MKKLIVILITFAFTNISNGQVTYPYPLHSIELRIEKQNVKMAYMDVGCSFKPKGKSVILFHGKNFNGYYWKDVIKALTQTGYRVIVPDQVGWGKSDKPDLHYSFQMLADNNETSRFFKNKISNCNRPFNGWNAGNKICIDVS